MSEVLNAKGFEENLKVERHEEGFPSKGFYEKSFALSLLLAVIFVCFIKFPRDDGLRHVGLAFANSTGKLISTMAVPTVWGEVYPYSYFELLKDYDPWFGYDLVLKIIATALKYLPISSLLSQFLLMKMLSLFFVSVFLYFILARSGILQNIKDRDTFVLAYIVLFLLALQPFLRVLLARPFGFGTLFLLYVIGQKGILRGVLSSAALAFFYPYLAWFYTIPVSLAHFLKGDKKFAFGTIIFSLLFLAVQPPSFWGFQLALFKTDLVRGSINLKVTEFYSGLNLSSFKYFLGFLILYPWLSRKDEKLTPENLLIIFYVIPSLKYVRYFVDLILPLLFVSFGRETLNLLLEPYQKFTSYVRASFIFWRAAIATRLQKLKFLQARTKRKKRDVNLKPYIAVLYALIFILVLQLNHQKFSSFKEFRETLSVIPAGSLVLAHFNLQYRILYVRPDLQVIPSCEIAFPTDSIRKEYLGFLNEGDVISLARKTAARFLLEQQSMYINPESGNFLRLVKKKNKLRVWEILGSSEANTAAQAKPLDNFISVG